ncbi:ROM2 [[Candida] subhashii]|uniref:ROM2 n=1 Tax=[Candida] subhashii TaxID=561895 RepID=A0A8J5QM62_9ASCO|nr:ROM2 [[Candida] subhashii]KAG7664648.1 ROM2 [[Candida] subhashii]
MSSNQYASPNSRNPSGQYPNSHMPQAVNLPPHLLPRQFIEQQNQPQNNYQMNETPQPPPPPAPHGQQRRASAEQMHRHTLDPQRAQSYSSGQSYPTNQQPPPLNRPISQKQQYQHGAPPLPPLQQQQQQHYSSSPSNYQQGYVRGQQHQQQPQYTQMQQHSTSHPPPQQRAYSLQNTPQQYQQPGYQYDNLPPQPQQHSSPHRQPPIQPHQPYAQQQSPLASPVRSQKPQLPYPQQRQDDLPGLDQRPQLPQHASASSLTYDTSPNSNQRRMASMDSYHSQYNNLPYPVDGNANAQQQQTSPQPQSQQQFPQQSRRSSRRAATGNLPPIQTNEPYTESHGRRIVSTPTAPNMPINNQLTHDSRTKSLSSGSQKYSQQSQQQQQHHQQPPSHTNGHRPSSSSSGSGSSLHHSNSRSLTSLTKLSSLSTKKFGSSSSIPKVLEKQTPKRHTSGAAHKPAVYPALLSAVAKIFREAIILTINTKDGLEYHDTFTGKMAVDIICRIIRTNDRNLALLLGRSLDAQKFFHDVTYNHRLRDSVHEVYAFNHVYNDVEFYHEETFANNNNNSGENSKHGSFLDSTQLQSSDFPVSPQFPPGSVMSENSTLVPTKPKELTASQQTGVNGVFTILTDCYSPTCSRNRLCYSIACPRRLEQQARLNLKPQGGLKRAVSRLSIHEQEESETLWHKTVPQSVLDKLDKHEKTRQELIYEFVYTERDYVKDLEFMTDFYIMPLRNPANNIIPEHQRETFIHTVFGGVSDLLRLAKNFSEALTRRQQQQKPVVEEIADVFLDHVGLFEPFIRYSGNKVFAAFEHERQQQVNMKYARFLDAIEKKPESRRQDLSSFLIKGVQRPARYQLFLAGILKHTKPESPDYKNLVKAKEEIEKVLARINVQTGESTDRHKIMVLHRLLGKQTLENKFNFKLSYNNRIIYQASLTRKRDNEKIDLYLFEHALLLVKHKIQNKREQHKVFEKPMYLPLLFVNGGYEIPVSKTIMNHRYNGSIVSDTTLRNQRTETNYIGNTLNSSNTTKCQLNFFGLGSNQVHVSLFADDVAVQSQVLQQVQQQQKKLIDNSDLFSLTKFETRRFQGNNKINCAVPCYGGKKLLYGTDSGVWVSTVRSINMNSSDKIVSDPTMVISKVYVTQIEVLVEYSKLLVLSDKSLYEFDLSCTDSLDHLKNTKSGKLIMTHISFFKIGICDGRLLICGAKTGGQHTICIFEPLNPFDKGKNRNRKVEVQEIPFSSDPISISFLKTKLCVGCAKGFEILSLEAGKKEPILDEADPSLDFAIQRETVNPLAIHRLGRDFLLCYAEFVFLINRNGWRTNHDWGIFWEGNPQNVALFFPYLLSFEPGFIEIRDLHTTNLLRALTGENIRYLHSNEHEAMYACEENGYDIIVSIDFLNLKPKSPTSGSSTSASAASTAPTTTAVASSTTSDKS